MAALATFVRFRLWFEAGSDSAHASTASQFTDDINALATPIWGQYQQNVFEMKDSTGTYTVRERGMCGLHWINTTSGSLDATWTSADFAAAESAFTTFWTAVSAMIPNDVRLIEQRWYPFGPGVVKPNPPSRVTAVSPMQGSFGTASVAHQLASTVTLRTALRRHWGRFYMPLGGAVNATGGTIDSSNCDTIANAARTLLTGPGTAQGVVPVVWDKVHHRAYGVTAIEVDSVPDIIRRRRARTTNYRKIISS